MPHTASQDFYRSLLAGKTAPTPAPCAESRTNPLPRTGYGELSQSLSLHATHALAELAASLEVTPEVLLHAAWAVLLARYTREEDLLFGHVRSVRGTALGGLADEIIGQFSNTLPLRVRVDPANTRL